MSEERSFKRLVLRAALRHVSPMVIRVISISDRMDLSMFNDIFCTMLGLGGEQVSKINSASGDMTWAHSNVYAAGRLLATYSPSGLHYQFSDWLGTRRVQSLVGASGTDTVEETCQSLAYGDALTCSGTDATEQHFTGKERDTESGNDYFGARYYGSSMGRFMSPDDGDDPFGPAPVPYSDFENPQSLNLYSYAYNNPLTNTDPTGHDVQVCSADGNGNQQCTIVSNDQYQAAQQATNAQGLLNVPSLTNVGANGTSNITDSSGNTVGTATYVPDSGVDFYSNQGAYAQLANTSKVVTAGTAIYAGVYGAVGGAILGGEVAASTAAARSNLIFRLAHGTDLKALLNIGHNVPIAEIGEIKNAIATAVATGSITSLGGNAFQGVVNVAGTFIRFTGATTPSGTVISNVMGAALQK